MYESIFLILSFLGLTLTWYNNVNYLFVTPFQLHKDPLLVIDAFVSFFHDALSNPLAACFCTEVIFLFMTVILFMFVESKKKGHSHSFYVLGGYMIAIAHTFPLFVYHWLKRERSDTNPKNKVGHGSYVTGLYQIYAYIIASAIGFTLLVNSTSNIDVFYWLFVVVYLLFSHCYFILYSPYYGDGLIHMISNEDRATLVMFLRLWSYWVAAVLFAVRAHAMCFYMHTFPSFSLSHIINLLFTSSSASASLSFDYIILSLSFAFFVLLDPKQTKHKMAHLLVCVFCAPLGASLYMTQREIDDSYKEEKSNELKNEKHQALVDFGVKLAKLSWGTLIAEIIIFKFINFPNVEKFSFEFVAQVPAFYLAPTHKLYHIGTGDWILGVAHIFGGFIYLLIMPFQFSPNFRGKYISWHRWMGRLSLLGSLGSSVGLLQMIMYPQASLFAGNEALTWWAVFIFGSHFFITGLLAYLYATGTFVSKDITIHRSFMIRHMSNAMAVGAYRVFASAANLVMPLSLIKNPQSFFGVGICLLWPMALFLGEIMIKNRYWEPK